MRIRPLLSRPTPTILVVLVMATSLAGCAEETDQPDGVETSTGEGRTAESGPPVPAPTTPSAPSPLPPVAPTTHPAPVPPFVDSVSWTDSAYGPTLKISPTDAGRAATEVGDAQLAWQEVLALAPDAESPGMWEQFECHWTWARLIQPDKPTWNIEPWRPVVDQGQMISEGCNPGAPEV